MNLRKLNIIANLSELIVDDYTVIYNIKDSDKIQPKLFKLGCIWNGHSSGTKPEEQKPISKHFTHVIIRAHKSITFINEPDLLTDIDGFIASRPKYKSYRLINASRII